MDNTDNIDYIPIIDEKIQSGEFSHSENKDVKRKKKKRIENFKQMKLLNNILDAGGVDEEGGEGGKGGGEGGGDKEGGDVREGMTNLAADAENFDIYKWMVDLVNMTRNGILYCEYQLSYHITHLLSLGEFEEDDVDVLQKYVMWFSTICISCYCVYNWYYVMFFRSIDDSKIHTQASDVTRWNLTLFSNNSPVVNLAEPYVTFSVFFPEFTQKTIIDRIPQFIPDNISAAFIFCGLFYSLIYFFYNFSNWFYLLILDILNVNVENVVVDIIYVVVIILFLIRWVENEIFDLNSAGKFFQKAINNAMSKTPYVQIFYYIMYLIYFIVVIMITPFLGGVMSVLVILFISFFAMGFSVFENIININEYTQKSLKSMDKDTYCKPLTFFDKVTNIINWLSAYLYKYVFHSAFLFMVIWSFYDYTNHIKSDYLKLSLLVINTLIIFVIGVIVYIDMWKHLGTDDQLFGEG